ncbi:MAG: diphthine synthase [Candidatus Pacearchaeota archaeon]
MLYLIGLGLDIRGIALHGKKILKSAKIKKVYLENYTIDFPYSKKELEKELKIRVIEAGREFVESEELVKIAKNEDVVLLVYGSPLNATTHISLINSCKKQKIKYKILYSASVIDAIAETGLSLYKFGKTTSLPKWQNNYKPTSFMEVIKENQSINAHTLLLIDIGLDFKEAKKELKESGFKSEKEKIIVCIRLGVKSKFFYDYLEKIPEDKIEKPYCIIIPGKLSHDEEENLKNLF